MGSGPGLAGRRVKAHSASPQAGRSMGWDWRAPSASRVIWVRTGSGEKFRTRASTVMSCPATGSAGCGMRRVIGDIRRSGGCGVVGADDDVFRQAGGEVPPGGGLEIRDDDEFAVAAGLGELAQGEIEGGVERAGFGAWVWLAGGDRLEIRGWGRVPGRRRRVRQSIQMRLAWLGLRLSEEARGLGAGGIEAAAGPLAGGHGGGAIDEQDDGGFFTGERGGFWK